MKRVLRFKDHTPGAATDYTNRLNSDQRLDEVLQDLCIPRASLRLNSCQPAQPIQLRRAELTPLARGWHEFIIHSIILTGNKSEITLARAILIHAIIKGEDVRVEELIADNIAIIAQGMQGEGKLAFPSTIFKLCKDVEVPMREFKLSELIPQDKLITARLMESTRFGRNVQVAFCKKTNQCLSLREAMRKTTTKGSINTFSLNINNQKQVSSRVIGSSSSKAST
ncbi:hypothetical protein PIB30_044055 [Stylosanthes scabra]|uniref:Putative plant transposon protein domain-containing protein n=1 Tax=Stylosanthes scabra TaxID=79078 RepID=A0ABU6UH17_9FABA|nr:hypothetical protein [Stylosanthes scabra]